MNKMTNYLRALERLQEAVGMYQAQRDNSLYQDGLIQRFEFTTELAWKSLKEYLEDQGAELRGTPKAVLKEAFSAGLVQEELAWVAILDARNQTFHIYKEETAREIAQRICESFLPVFQALAAVYRENS